MMVIECYFEIIQLVKKLKGGSPIQRSAHLNWLILLLRRGSTLNCISNRYH